MRSLKSFLAGGLMVLAFAPFYFLPTLLISIPALLMLMDQVTSRKQAFLTGWAFGFGFFTIGLYWISYSLFIDIAQFWYILPFSLLGLPAFLALFVGFGLLLYHIFKPQNPYLKILWLAVCWSGVEWIRGHIWTGFPWNLVGNVWTGYLPTLQLASLIGVYGLSFLTILGAGLIYVRTRRAIYTLLTFFFLTMFYGHHVLQNPAPSSPLYVRIVQANIDQKLKLQRSLYRIEAVRQYLKGSAEPSDHPLDLIIWTETAVNFDLATTPVIRDRMASLLHPGQYIITGVHHILPPQVWNGIEVIDAQGEITATFDKFHLLPFGEYIPYRQYIPLKSIAGGSIDFSAGLGPRSLHLQNIPPFSPLICFESSFSGQVLDPQDPPQWLLNISNDGWFGNSIGPYQHFAQSQIRAVEEGIPLIRAANTGISGVVDPYGRVLGKIDLGVQGKLDLYLPEPRPSLTFFRSYGNLPFGLTLFISTCLILWRSYVIRSR